MKAAVNRRSADSVLTHMWRAWAPALVLTVALSPSADVGSTVSRPATAASSPNRAEIDPAIRPKKGDFRLDADGLFNLLWLARHQSEDGSWSVTGYANRCEGERKCLPNPGSNDLDIGVTGLALFAFFGAGYTHLSRETYRGISFGDVVKRGLQFLMRRQRPNGDLADESRPRPAMNHALATLALTEGYRLTASAMLRDAAQKAIDRLLELRAPGGAWGDVITTAWCVTAFLSAYQADLAIAGDRSRIAQEVDAWLDARTADSGRTGYRSRGFDAAVIPGRNADFAPLPTCTAAAAAVRVWIDRSYRGSEAAARQIRLVEASPLSAEPQARDAHHAYWATLALFLHHGPAGAPWKRWNPLVKERILSTANRNGKACSLGSWEPDDKWSCEGGRVYATAMNCLTELVYYRYPDVLAAKDDARPQLR
jgi:hypothetical protein